MTVLVLGNAAIDWIFEVERLPRSGESVLAGKRHTDLGGKGLNQAVAAARAGARVRLGAPVGGDAHGRLIADRLLAEGIDPAFLERHPGVSDLSLVFVTPDGENAIVSVLTPEGGLSPAAVERALHGLGDGDLLLVSGNLARETLHHALSAARSRGLSTLLNPAPVPFDYAELWPRIGLVLANAAELALHTGGRDPEAAVRFLRAAGAGAVLATLGAAGALFADASGTIRVPAPRVDVVDTTGAGDVLAGTFTGLLDRGIDRGTALRVAVAAASAKVARPGTLSAFPSRAEIEALLVTAAA